MKHFKIVYRPSSLLSVPNRIAFITAKNETSAIDQFLSQVKAFRVISIIERF